MLDIRYTERVWLSSSMRIEPSPNGWPRRLWSLYAMLRFYAERFARVYRLLGGMRDFLDRREMDGIDERDYRRLTSRIDSLSFHLSGFYLSISMEMAEKLRQHCEDRYSIRTLSADLDQLFNVIESELKSVVFIQIPKARQGYYDSVVSQVNERVVHTLLEVISDLEEGAKCFALGRHTACVFHLMRVMEMTVQRLGRKFKITLVQEKNWQYILDQVNKAIKDMNPKTVRGKILKVEYGAIAAHLFNVKIAWRNSVMHPKDSYTEEEAEDVLRAVLVFINHLARTVR